VASGYLQNLHRDTGETVNLTVLVGDDVLYLDKIIAPRPVRFSTRVGSRVAAPLTSGGKAMLARLIDSRERLTRIATQRTLDVDALLAELEEVRARGYAVSGYSPGVVSTGAAVIGPGHAPIAALSVSAPRERLDAAKSKAIAEAVLETCARMAEAVNRP
jgi:DNA-binding IclR family transcriptional regulator